MKTIASLLVLVFSFAGFSVQAQTTNLYFGYDLDQLTAEHKVILKNFVDSLQCDSFQMTVIGHTDNHASDEYNIALSGRRTNSTIEELVALGVNPEFIVEAKKGEFQPVATNESDGGRARNRRVEIQVKCEQTFGTIEDIITLLQKPYDSTYISGTEASVIMLPQGTMLDIPANNFRNKQGEIVNDVTLYTSEVYSYSDMIRTGVVTQTNDLKLLQTGGMLRVITVKDGDTLEMVQPITAGMNTDSVLSNYSVFTGSENDDLHGAISWKLDKDSLNLLADYPSVGCCGLNCGSLVYRSFWNRIGNFFGTNSWGNVRYGNSFSRRGNRAYYDRCSPYIEGMSKSKLTPRQYIDSLYADEYLKYGVNNYEAYLGAVYQAKVDSVNDRFRSALGGINELNTLVSLTGSSWYNLDEFMKLKKREQTELIVRNDQMNSTFIRCIVPRYNVCVAPTSTTRTKGEVDPLKKGVDITVFACQIINGKPYMALHRIEDINNVDLTLDFKPVTREELLQSLEDLSIVNEIAVN